MVTEFYINSESNIRVQYFVSKNNNKNIFQFTVSNNSLKDLKELIQKIIGMFDKTLDFNQEIDEYLHYKC